jgi:hypothetical protein
MKRDRSLAQGQRLTLGDSTSEMLTVSLYSLSGPLPPLRFELRPRLPAPSNTVLRLSTRVQGQQSPDRVEKVTLARENAADDSRDTLVIVPVSHGRRGADPSKPLELREVVSLAYEVALRVVYIRVEWAPLSR